MKKVNVLTLAIFSAAFSTQVIAEQPLALEKEDAVIYANGEQVAGVYGLAALNVKGDQAAPLSDEYSVVIFSKEGHQGESHRVNLGEPTPFAFQSVKVVNAVPEKPTYKPVTSAGLYVAVKEGTPCIDLSSEIYGENPAYPGVFFLNALPDWIGLFKKPQLHSPFPDRLYTKLCAGDQPLNLQNYAAEVLGDKIYSNTAYLRVDGPDYQFTLKGHYGRNASSYGNFYPERNLEYFGSVGNWSDVIAVIDTPNDTTGYILIGR